MDISLYFNSEANVWYNKSASRNAYEEVFPAQLSKKYSFLCYALAKIVDTIVDVALKIFSTDYSELKTKYMTHYMTEKAKYLQSTSESVTIVHPPQLEAPTTKASSSQVEPIFVEPLPMSFTEEEVVEQIASGHPEDIFEDDSLTDVPGKATGMGFVPGGPTIPLQATAKTVSVQTHATAPGSTYSSKSGCKRLWWVVAFAAAAASAFLLRNQVQKFGS